MATADEIALLAEAARLQRAESIEKAYRQLAQGRHPDHHGGSDAAMQKLNAARERLLATKPAPAAGERKPVAPPMASAVQPAESARTRWCATAPAHARIEDVLDPGWLGAVAKLKGMKALDRVEVVHEKAALLVEALITTLDAEAATISLKPLKIIDLTQVPTIAFDWSECEVVEHAGGWGIRGQGRVLKAGLQTLGMAQAWLDAKRQVARAS